jgi:nucleotide-binding universal stress UspA family protein
MTSIIAATDFTPRSSLVARRAVYVARALKVDVVFVHVLEKPKKPGDAAGVTVLAAMQTQMRAAFQDAPDVAVSCRIMTGRPDAVLSDLAETEEATLIILGLHHERRVLDLLRMTTMERIVLAADVPVLLAHRAADGPYQCVLGAVDFSPASARALVMAGHIAPDAQIHAIHAQRRTLRRKFSDTKSDGQAPRQTAETMRDGFMQRPGLPAKLTLPEIIPGGIHEVLAFRLEELQPDLLSIGTHSGREPDMLGNYARDLMRAPPTDVLVAKP